MKFFYKLGLVTERISTIPVIFIFSISIILIALLLAMCSINLKDTENFKHTPFYNDLTREVELHNEELTYSEVTCNSENSEIMVRICSKNLSVELFKEFVSIYKEINSYLKIKNNYHNYNIVVILYCHSAGREFNVAIIDFKSERLEIKCDWIAITLKDIADAFPGVEVIELYNDNINGRYYDDIVDVAKFSDLELIVCVNWEISKEEENYIMSIFPDCHIIHSIGIFSINCSN